ncbi:hypothetical protein INT45_007414 [Circinella minor]|uniref:Myb-like domain-containing protein n=1 Tax=Circinella minor TaxID=1195481 RepID=A0A8H7RQJ1_9FUNG|nr:hypothetical protein INT45_007414 [Circinella minor]
MDVNYLLCHDSDKNEENKQEPVEQQQQQQENPLLFHSDSSSSSMTPNSDLIFSLPLPPQISRSSESFIPRSSFQQPMTTRKRRRTTSETATNSMYCVPMDTCRYYYSRQHQPIINHHQTRIPWTPFEDTLLKRGYNEGLSWAMISSTYLPHRSRGCCWGRYKTLQMKLQRQQKNQK